MLTLNSDSTPPLSARHSSFHGCSWNNGKINKDDGSVLNIVPRASYNFIHDVKLGKILPHQSSEWSESEMTPCSSSLSSIASNGAPNLKSSMELVKEITSLETEILHLERYILSLYRTAFLQREHSLHTKKSPSEHKIVSKLEPASDLSLLKNINSDALLSGQNGQLVNRQIKSANSNSLSRKERKTSRCSLGDHLGTAYTDSAHLDRPDRLSEDIMRCICSIYCKLGDQNQSQSGPSVSSASSRSSSGTNCTHNLSDTSSPSCNEEATWDSKHNNIKEEGGTYAEMVEVLKINVDDDSFSYAEMMLKKFRALVKKLENVDPGKMKREQKLVFWINIHNALVMHAYLAYGTHNNTKSNSILKATYNIGGHSINAYIIQISILGIKPHFRASWPWFKKTLEACASRCASRRFGLETLLRRRLRCLNSGMRLTGLRSYEKLRLRCASGGFQWLQSLLSPGRKLKTEHNKHIYAIEYPEPLVHFALSLGAFSDPAVRIYNAKNIFQDLRLAKQEFIQSTVYVNKETRIYLPKILYYFAKDMALSMSSLLEIVNSCLSESQPKVKKMNIKDKPEKSVHWLSQTSIFRYVIHRNTVEGRLSV